MEVQGNHLELYGSRADVYTCRLGVGLEEIPWSSFVDAPCGSPMHLEAAITRVGDMH